MNILRIFILGFFVFGFNMSYTQDCQMFFPTDEGAEMEIQNFNQKDKLSGTTIQKIVEKTTDGDALTVKINHQSFDAKGKELGKGDFEIRCENGTFYLDMRNYLDDQALSAYQDMELEIETTDMEFPGDMDVGKNLPDANITVKVKADNSMPVFTMTVFITNRRVAAKEQITTPAGTFDCFKMTYDIETKMVMRIQAKVVEWIAENVGMVKSESYSKKGKLQGYSVLARLE
jgi:hypothetical protein